MHPSPPDEQVSAPLPPEPSGTTTGRPGPGAWMRREFPYLILVAGLLFFLVVQGLLLEKPPPAQAPYSSTSTEAPKPGLSLLQQWTLMQEFLEDHPEKAIRIGILSLLIGGVLAAGGALFTIWLALTISGRDIFKPRAWPPRNWGIWDIIKCMAVYLFLMVCTADAANWLRTFPSWGNWYEQLSDLQKGLAAQAPASVLICLFIIYLTLREKGHRARDIGLEFRANAVAFGLLGYLSAMPLVVISAIAGVWLASQIGYVPHDHPIAREFLESDSFLELATLIFFACVMAPVWEELFFRGILYPVARRFCGVAGGILVTATLFSAMHGNLAQFLPILVLGILLTYLFEKTNSIWSSIAAHATFNFGSMIVLILMKDALPPGLR